MTATALCVPVTTSDTVAGANAGGAAAPLHIVFLLGGLGIGGAERQAITVAGALGRLGQRVTIVTIDDGPLREAVEREGIPLYVLGRVGGLSPAALPRLRRCLRTLDPDVVYAFLEVQWLLTLAAVGGSTGVRRPRIVFGLRAGEYVKPTSGIRSRVVYELVRRAASRADLLVANSRAGLTDLLSRCVGTPSGSGIVVPNGIDTTRFTPQPASSNALRAEWNIPADGLVVGHVGRLHPVKDHATLIDAFARFATRHAHAYLVCVGDGSASLRNELQQHAAACGVAERVRFSGARHDLARVYSAFDMLALSSLIEGFPNVVAEAMACGVPAVVTDAGASREIVGEYGEVVPMQDAVAFAAALERLAGRRSSALSIACRDRIVAEFTVNGCAVRTLDALASLTTCQVHS